MYTTGHMAIAIVSRKSKGLCFLLFCMCLTMAPDIDFLIGIEHHTLTHSISFCLLISYILSRVFKGQFLYFLFLTCSHLILDMVCLDTIHHGIQLLWPISLKFFEFPWHYFPSVPIYYAESLEFLLLICMFLIVEWARIYRRMDKVVSTFVINMWRH